MLKEQYFSTKIWLSSVQDLKSLCPVRRSAFKLFGFTHSNYFVNTTSNCVDVNVRHWQNTELSTILAVWHVYQYLDITYSTSDESFTGVYHRKFLGVNIDCQAPVKSEIQFLSWFAARERHQNLILKLLIIYCVYCTLGNNITCIESASWKLQVHTFMTTRDSLLQSRSIRSKWSTYCTFLEGFYGVITSSISLWKALR